jgi:hypothetical protein
LHLSGAAAVQEWAGPLRTSAPCLPRLPPGLRGSSAKQTYIQFNLRGTDCETTRLTKESAKQREESMRFQRDCMPNGLVSCFAERLWQTRLPGSSDAGQDGRRRYLRLGDDRSGAPVESEIGEVHLRQHEDQREQEKLETKQGPTPRLHQIPPYGGNLSHPRPLCQQKSPH